MRQILLITFLVLGLSVAHGDSCTQAFKINDIRLVNDDGEVVSPGHLKGFSKQLLKAIITLKDKKTHLYGWDPAHDSLRFGFLAKNKGPDEAIDIVKSLSNKEVTTLADFLYREMSILFSGGDKVGTFVASSVNLMRVGPRKTPISFTMNRDFAFLYGSFGHNLFVPANRARITKYLEGNMSEIVFQTILSKSKYKYTEGDFLQLMSAD